jgi:hypothetical protein
MTAAPTPEQFNLATELVRVSEENTRLAAEVAKLTEERNGLAAVNTQLVKIGTGELRHMFRGQCPDEVEGFDVRDPGCPACGLLDAIPTATLAARDAEKKAEGWDEGYSAGRNPMRYGDPGYYTWDDHDGTWYQKPGVDPQRTNPYRTPQQGEQG